VCKEKNGEEKKVKEVGVGSSKRVHREFFVPRRMITPHKIATIS
jgi:hypothetical protein